MVQQTDEKGQPLTYWGGLKDRTCHHSNCREVCPECKTTDIKKVMRIDDINAMADADIIKNEINKLAEEQSEIQGWGEYQGLSEQNGFKDAYINGYNKAKETLYTKEQLMEVIELARLIDYNGSNDYYMSEDEIIKALKP